MRLSRQCEIAIDLLVFCARSPDRLVRTREAAAFANATKDHAHQIAVHLVRAHLLEGIRGRPGGIRLARRASQIVVGEVVKLMEPSLSLSEATSRSGIFDSVVREATQAALDTFDAFTIADLAEEEPGARLACLNCEWRSQFRAPRRQLKTEAFDNAATSLQGKR